MSNTTYRSKLLTSEDYWAIWIGSFLLLGGLTLYLVIGHQLIGDELKGNRQSLKDYALEIPFKTIGWYKENERSSELTGANLPAGKLVSKILTKPKSWKTNPLTSFVAGAKSLSDEDAVSLSQLRDELKELESIALEKERKAREATFGNAALNSEAEEAAMNWQLTLESLTSKEKKAVSKGYNVLGSLVILGILLAVLFGIGAFFMGYKYFKFVLAFAGVFLLAVLSYMLAAQADMKNMGIS